MPDDDKQENTNQQQSTSPSAITGKKIVIGADGGFTQQDFDAVANELKTYGNTVQQTQIGPNQESYLKGHGADIAIYLCNGVAPATIWSFVHNAIKPGSLPFTIFAYPGWAPYHTDEGGTLSSIDTVRKVSFENEWDAGQFMDASSTSTMQNEGAGAKTIGEYVDANSQYVGLCWGATPKELAQNICNGSCGKGTGGSGGVVSSSGGGAQIKDKTFEKCIRRICAATDSIFLVENNAAVLFPYTDWMAFTLRQKINTIKKNEIDPKVFSMEYGNDGFYNKVSIAWGGATLPERFSSDKESKTQIYKDKVPNANYTVNDILSSMEQNNFKISNLSNKKQDNKTTTTTKKDNTTQKISVDENGVTILSEQYDKFVEIYGEQEKRVQSSAPDFETAQYIVNALLIQYIRDYNYTCKCRAINNRKYIGGTFYAVENPFDDSSELFYLNGYTMRTQKHEPIYYDLEFKYGPEGAEEVLDYQALSGGGAASGEGGVVGGSATEEEIWKGTKKACHQWTCEELRVSESDTQDPQVAEDYYNKNVKAGKKFCLTCYGMSAWLYYQFNYKAGIPCRVIGNGDHHVVELFKNNQWYKPEKEYRKYTETGYHYNDFCRGNAPVLLEPPSSLSSTSGGNTSPRNTNNGNGNGH